MRSRTREFSSSDLNSLMADIGFDEKKFPVCKSPTTGKTSQSMWPDMRDRARSSSLTKQQFKNIMSADARRARSRSRSQGPMTLLDSIPVFSTPNEEVGNRDIMTPQRWQMFEQMHLGPNTQPEKPIKSELPNIFQTPGQDSPEELYPLDDAIGIELDQIDIIDDSGSGNTNGNISSGYIGSSRASIARKVEKTRPPYPTTLEERRCSVYCMAKLKKSDAYCRRLRVPGGLFCGWHKDHELQEGDLTKKKVKSSTSVKKSTTNKKKSKQKRIVNSNLEREEHNAKERDRTRAITSTIYQLGDMLIERGIDLKKNKLMILGKLVEYINEQNALVEKLKEENERLREKSGIVEM